MKRRIILFTLWGAIVLAGPAIPAWRSTGPTSGNARQDLESIVADTVRGNQLIKNCVLSVRKGDGSLNWSGAAGIASQATQAPMTKDTPIYLASVTKLYTAAAIMRLYERGALAPNDPMAKYLPDDVIHGIHVYQGHDYSREITIGQLLSHSSGIADYYSEKSKDGKTMFELFAADPARPWTVDETIARARDEMTPNFKPGEGTSYSDTNFQLLGKIIESVTGRPLQAVYDELFFTPLGLAHTWLVGRSRPQADPSVPVADVFSKDTNITRIRANGAYWADGGIVSTVEDAIEFLRALNTGKILHPDTLRLMHSDWRPLRNMPFQYGYGTMRFTQLAFGGAVMNVPPVWGHTGSVGSFLYYAADLDLYLAGTIDQTENKIAPIMLMVKVMRAMEKPK